MSLTRVLFLWILLALFLAPLAKCHGDHGDHSHEHHEHPEDGDLGEGQPEADLPQDDTEHLDEE